MNIRPLGTSRYDILPLDADRCRVYRHTIVFTKSDTTYFMILTGAVWSVDAPIAHDDAALDAAIATIHATLP